MHKRKNRILIGGCLLLSGTYLFASGNLACGSLFSEAAVSAVDMCFIFDCTTGALGGLIDPCGTTGSTDTNSGGAGGGGGGGRGGTFVGSNSGPFFADCANVQPPNQ
ncbi:MAG: hypothetical protein ACE5GE_03655 [Phycisphaerae bacterium]